LFLSLEIDGGSTLPEVDFSLMGPTLVIEIRIPSAGVQMSINASRNAPGLPQSYIHIHCVTLCRHSCGFAPRNRKKCWSSLSSTLGEQMGQSESRLLAIPGRIFNRYVMFTVVFLLSARVPPCCQAVYSYFMEPIPDFLWISQKRWSEFTCCSDLKTVDISHGPTAARKSAEERGDEIHSFRSAICCGFPSQRTTGDSGVVASTVFYRLLEQFELMRSARKVLLPVFQVESEFNFSKKDAIGERVSIFCNLVCAKVELRVVVALIGKNTSNWAAEESDVCSVSP
jgi:hypothetical protein